MVEVDRLMVEDYGITLLQMMENAGRSLAELTSELLGGVVKGKRIAVLCGGGNNGGGGMAAARHLVNRGADVQVALGSQRPGKITIGDYTDASNPLASEKSYSDWQGGILVEVGDPAKDQDRLFFGDVRTRFNGHLLLPRLATLTSGFPSQADVNVLIEYNNTEFATAGTAVHSYNNTTDSWGSSLETMAAAGTDGNADTVRTLSYHYTAASEL